MTSAQRNKLQDSRLVSCGVRRFVRAATMALKVAPRTRSDNVGGGLAASVPTRDEMFRGTPQMSYMPR
jgi:hypothetical protein